MFQNCTEDVVKEEYVIQEANPNDYNHQWLTSDPTRKCGEVFLGHRGTFTFVCSQCLQTFLDLCSFGEHIRDIHSLHTVESLVSNVVNDKCPLKLESADKFENVFDLCTDDIPNTIDRMKSDPAESDFDLLRTDEVIHDSIDLSYDTHWEGGPIQSNEESFRSAVEEATTRSATYCCYTCGKIFVRFRVYRTHYSVEHPDMIDRDNTNETDPCNPTGFVPKIPEEMVCKYCLRTFDEPTYYHKHMEFDHPSPKRYSCPHCPHRLYKSRNHRDCHLGMHDDTKRYYCPHCPKTFTNSRTLLTHVNMHKLPIVESFVSNFINNDSNPLKSEPADTVESDSDLRTDEEEVNSQDIHDLSDNSHLKEEAVQFNEESFKTFTPEVKQAKTNHSKTHCCYTCGKIFVAFKKYHKHYRVEHPDMIKKDDPNKTDPCNPKAFVPKMPKEMVCRYCLSTFDEPTNYHKHMEFDHPSPKCYTCPRCPHRPYRHKNSRDYHLDMHDGTKRFQCPHCPKAFTYPRTLQTHINTHKLSIAESLVSNVVIGDINPPADQVENDLDLRTDEVANSIHINSMKSELADKVDSDFDLGIDKKEENSKGIHDSIDLCDDSRLEEATVQSNEESFTLVKQAKRQQKWTHSKTYCCYTCGKMFALFEKYHKHYRIEHPEMIKKDDTNKTDPCNPKAFVPKIPKEMVCKFCLSTFDEPTNYHKHLKFDHQSPKYYTCPRCPHRPYQQKKHRDHHLTLHDGKKSFQCPHCPKRYSDPSYLQSHVNIHLNIKPFSCKFCDQKYTHKRELRIHERIHTKERPFQCDECGMSFIARDMLTQHQRKHHKNMRMRYPCQYCDKAFFSSPELIRHIRTHTKDNSCDTCGKKVRTRSNPRSHESLHYDDK